MGILVRLLHVSGADDPFLDPLHTGYALLLVPHAEECYPSPSNDNDG
ncbi:MAG: hypothetical protein OJF50_001129 [Nitrospira sp.]|jgi:hypothetical protein|nr:hypothetical protein [Nitrospira sp.]